MMYLHIISNATKLIEELTRNLDANNEYVGMAMEKWNEIVTYTINVVTNVLRCQKQYLKSGSIKYMEYSFRINCINILINR